MYGYDYLGADYLAGTHLGGIDPSNRALIYGDSTIVVSGRAIRFAASSISGDSTVVVNGIITRASLSLISGDSTMTVTSYRQTFIGQTAVSGDSTVVGTGIRKFASQPKIYGNSTLVVDSNYTQVAYAKIEKQVMYKVFDQAGQILSVWSSRHDVISTPVIKQQINNAGSEVVLTLARPADSYGEGFDVNYENRIECWVADKDAPNGVCMFIGRTSKYKPNYNNETVDITVLGYGSKMGLNLIEGSGTPASTTVPYFSVSPKVILLDLVDKMAAVGIPIIATVDSVDDPGTVVSYTFNTNSFLDGVNKVLELCPSGWYYYIDQSVFPHVIHLHERGDNANHQFNIGTHITSLDIEKSIETIVNTIYFTGGDVGGGSILYKKYVNSTSIATYGVRAIKVADGRVTQETTADIIANRIMVGSPQILVNLGVGDNGIEKRLGYDIESVKIGQTVKIGNTGSSASSKYDLAIFDTSPYDYDLGNIGTIQFQITEKTYTLEQLVMSLSTTPPDVAKRIADIKRNVDDVTFGNNPATPSV